MNFIPLDEGFKVVAYESAGHAYYQAESHAIRSRDWGGKVSRDALGAATEAEAVMAATEAEAVMTANCSR